MGGTAHLCVDAHAVVAESTKLALNVVMPPASGEDVEKDDWACLGWRGDLCAIERAWESEEGGGEVLASEGERSGRRVGPKGCHVRAVLMGCTWIARGARGAPWRTVAPHVEVPGEGALAEARSWARGLPSSKAEPYVHIYRCTCVGTCATVHTRGCTCMNGCARCTRMSA